MRKKLNYEENSWWI